MWETWVGSLGWEDSPGEGKGYLLQYSGLGQSQHDPNYDLYICYTYTGIQGDRHSSHYFNKLLVLFLNQNATTLTKSAYY